MTSSQPIAVGISDTEASTAALLWAAARANRRQVPLAVLHVVDDRWMAGEALPYVDVLRQSGLDLLEAAGQRLRAAEPGLAFTLDLLEGGIGASLGNYAKKASMLVVGSSSHARAALTDRALQVAATAEVPVAVVGTHEGQGKGVVVGVDGSREATQAVAFAAAEAYDLGEELSVVYAFTGPNRWIKAGLPSSSFAELVVEEEQIVLSEEVAGIRQDYPGLVINEVLETVMEPADALINAASGARLLVMGSRGRGSFGRLLLGSTAHGVLTNPPCPTIITRLKKSGHKD
jgi:nucleotide-binding universal stress UspA family protein